ncbi:FabG Dehydrogenases with different specificities (related to short-chain alcohol dehydrogenases) [Rhabdaerophilaceae bacterium]
MRTMSGKILKGRVAVVTGASRGIGREAALALASAGAHIIAVARTVGALEALDDDINALGSSATLVPLDLKDFDALDRLGLAIHERWGKLDILLGNGAILGPISPVGHIDPKQWETVFATNVTANFRLIRSFDPLLRASDAGRAIFISSGASFRAYPYWSCYGASKAALDLMVRTYAEEVRNISPIRVMLVNPGAMRTRMRAEAAPGEDPMSLPEPKDLAPHFVAMASPEWQESGKLFDFRSRSVLSFEAPR